MQRYKVGCPACCGSFVQTNKFFDGKQLASELMIDIIPQFAGALTKDGLNCPSCGDLLTINARFNRLQPDGSIDVEPEAVNSDALKLSSDDDLKKANELLLAKIAELEKEQVPEPEETEESVIPEPEEIGNGEGFKCPECGKVLAAISSYQRHYQTQHIDKA